MVRASVTSLTTCCRTAARFAGAWHSATRPAQRTPLTCWPPLGVTAWVPFSCCLQMRSPPASTASKARPWTMRTWLPCCAPPSPVAHSPAMARTRTFASRSREHRRRPPCCATRVGGSNPSAPHPPPTSSRCPWVWWATCRRTCARLSTTSGCASNSWKRWGSTLPRRTS